MRGLTTMKQYLRSQSGALGSVLLCASILFTFAIGALAVDIAHVATVRTELQNATDAAALAGAMQLRQESATAESVALATAGKNTADGRAVSNQSQNTSVTVQVSAPTDKDSGEVRVSAETEVTHSFAPIFGGQTARVYSRSHAGASGPVTDLFSDIAFPIVVSADVQGGLSGLLDAPLQGKHIGDSMTLFVGANPVDPISGTNTSGFVSNASITSFFEPASSNDYIHHAFNQSLGLEPVVPGYRPSLTVGSNVNLASDYAVSLHIPENVSLLNNRVLILPAVSGQINPGQTQPIIGFIAFRVTNTFTTVQTGTIQIMTGTIVSSTVPGLNTPNGTDTGVWQELSPRTIKLIL